MSTEQNYSAQDNCANPADQLAAELDLDVSLYGIFPKKPDPNRKAIWATTAKLKKWTAKIMDQLPKASWLSEQEKREALRELQRHQADLEKIDNDFSMAAMSHLVSRRVAASFINLVLRYQAGVNQCMIWFELPVYRLPKSIKVNYKNPYLFGSYTAQSNVMAPQIPKGAHFSAVLVERKRWLRARGVVYVVYHENFNKSTPRCHVFGRLAHIDQDRLYLVYDNSKEGYLSIPLRLVAFIYKVKTVTLPVR